MAKLTKRGIEAMDPAEKDYFVWDSELSGFGIVPRQHQWHRFKVVI